jgi:hypothetical protein
MKTLISLILISSVTILASPKTFAQSAVERVTLMLNGSSCELSHPGIEEALKELPGVRTVDGHSIPGHLLIDVEKGRVTADELAHRVIEFSTAQSPCQASVMQSCITAGIGHADVP